MTRVNFLVVSIKEVIIYFFFPGYCSRGLPGLKECVAFFR